MCNVDPFPYTPFVFLELYKPTRMLDSWVKGQQMRKRDGNPTENLEKLSEFLAQTQVSSLEEITMKRGEKECFSLALTALVRMGLAEDNDESKYLRKKPQEILRGFMAEVNAIKSAITQGAHQPYQEKVLRLHTFFNHVIMTDYHNKQYAQPHGCFW